MLENLNKVKKSSTIVIGLVFIAIVVVLYSAYEVGKSDAKAVTTKVIDVRKP